MLLCSACWSASIEGKRQAASAIKPLSLCHSSHQGSPLELLHCDPLSMEVCSCRVWHCTWSLGRDSNQDSAACLKEVSGETLQRAFLEGRGRGPFYLHHISAEVLLDSSPVQSPAAVRLDVMQLWQALLPSLLPAQCDHLCEEAPLTC